MTSTPQPVRSSLLFSPVPLDQNTAATTTLTDQTSHGHSNSLSIPLSSDPHLSDSSTAARHQRRRSDFRSKSTDQIINGQSNSSVITAATTSSNVSASKFTNINVSQPVLRSAPLAPVPVIPATRFDTITSYVDVIYQHHHQQQQQQHQQQQLSNSLQAHSPSDHHLQAFRDPENIPEGQETNLNNDSNVVYLDPSDGIDGDQSFMATCPQCAMMVMTNIEPFPGRNSRKMACLFTPILLCWLPFNFALGKKWMDVRHSCPKCQSLIAIYRK